MKNYFLKYFILAPCLVTLSSFINNDEPTKKDTFDYIVYMIGKSYSPWGEDSPNIVDKYDYNTLSINIKTISSSTYSETTDSYSINLNDITNVFRKDINDDIIIMVGLKENSKCFALKKDLKMNILKNQSMNMIYIKTYFGSILKMKMMP